MKKKVFIGILYVSGIMNLYAMEEQSIEDLHRQAKKESGRYQTLSETGEFTGALVGGVLGGVGGGRLGKSIAQKTGITPKVEEFSGLIGGAAGGYLGRKIGSSLAREIVVPYYARKYGTSLKVAEAALIAGTSLQDPQMRSLFISAAEKNKNKFRKKLTRILISKAGKEWKSTIYNLIYEANKLLRVTNSSRITYDIMYTTGDGQLLIRIAQLLYPLSILYFGDTFIFKLIDFKEQVVATEKLMNALF